MSWWKPTLNSSIYALSYRYSRFLCTHAVYCAPTHIHTFRIWTVSSGGMKIKQINKEMNREQENWIRLHTQTQNTLFFSSTFRSLATVHTHTLTHSVTAQPQLTDPPTVSLSSSRFVTGPLRRVMSLNPASALCHSSSPLLDRRLTALPRPSGHHGPPGCFSPTSLCLCLGKVSSY